jgi:putative methionine-R-sulfoxide reductase with GAF domain
MSEKTFKPLQIILNAIGMFAIAAAGLQGCGWSVAPTSWIAIAVGVVAIATPQVFLHTGRVKRQAARHKNEALCALADLCFRFLDVSKDADPRVTLLGVDRRYSRPHLYPLARSSYNGDELPTSTMEVTQGIAGWCYRKKAVIVQEEITDFIATMKDLGFEDADAKQFDSTRKNYACIPVLDAANNVLAVLSLDANKPKVYDAARVSMAEKLTPFFARLLTMEATIEE